jgi:copper chaperone
MGGKGADVNIELNVTGMTCGHCKAAVETALKAVAGVTGVTVDLSSGKASVSGANLELAALTSAVAEEGYSASAAA